MGNLRACFVIASLALAAACGSDHATPDAAIKIIDAPPDAKVFSDAPPKVYDFSCMGNAAPTTATANITLSGTVQRVALSGTMPSIDPLGGATLKGCKAGSTNCSGQDQYGSTATSASDGSFSIGPFASGGQPVDGYVEMTATNSRPTQVFPASPLVADQGMIPVLTFDPTLIALLGQFTSCTQDDTTNGIIALAVTDCANAPIDDTPNLMINIKQGGTAVSGTTVLDLGALQAEAAGTYLICNVPENATTEVGATYKSMALRAHNVKVVKATTTATILRPGY
jgi:hypothetical protein